MSSACVSAQLPIYNSEKVSGGGPNFESVGFAIGGYRVQTEDTLTKAARKRNKKRAAIKDAAGGNQEGTTTRVDLKHDSLRRGKLSSQESVLDHVNAVDEARTSTGYHKEREPLVKVASSNSYAAVVSGRNGRDVSKLEETDEFLPLSSTSRMSVVEQKFSTPRFVSTRDVGIQVGTSSVKKGASKSKSQGTMTSRKNLSKNKFVTAKICCNNEDKETTTPASVLPVQFIGNNFTFEKALANTAADLGIKFVDD